MRKRRFPVALSVLLVLLFLGCGVITRWGYELRRPPTRPCKITELLLGEEAFPEGSSPGSTEHPVETAPFTLFRPWDSTARSFRLPSGGVAVQRIYRSATVTHASQKEYSRRMLEYFVADESEGPWERPAELTYVSTIASQCTVACGYWGGAYFCRLVAQYEEYVVTLSVNMNGNDMTYEGLEKVLQAIDEQMGACLSRPIGATPKTD